MGVAALVIWAVTGEALFTTATNMLLLGCDILVSSVICSCACIAFDFAMKKNNNKYEDAKTDLHNLKNDLYELHAENDAQKKQQEQQEIKTTKAAPVKAQAEQNDEELNK